ncbi:hypothetical protein LC087_02745 [Bacillus carboniphilus]|uniref:Uncharacterized protein n=1 Tax=Bacillus carboniphilus TaxID=86663 RepID=A0ABY9JXA9_9BACI|nr:hypothetical protein [Bacillus carboniphilus]WLR43142.1 hypothetical protein LC087_02745 [Bacillus carboniphilus]
MDRGSLYYHYLSFLCLLYAGSGLGFIYSSEHFTFSLAFVFNYFIIGFGLLLISITESKSYYIFIIKTGLTIQLAFPLYYYSIYSLLEYLQ